jgi:hypothetical protein
MIPQWLSGEATNWIDNGKDESRNIATMYHVLPIDRGGFFLASTQLRGSYIVLDNSFGSTTVRNGTNVAYVYMTVALHDKAIEDPLSISIDYIGLFY